MKLTGRVAVVTGSSRGIGKAIALAFAGAGADVAVVARTDEPDSRIPGTINETAEQIRAMGRRCLPVKTDLTQQSDIDEMAARVLSEFGRVDILVNNAGINQVSSLLETSVKRWDLVMSVNLRAPFLCTRALLPQMIKQGGGHIMNTSAESGSTYVSVENNSVCYSVSKAGVDRFTTGLAWELKDSNIAVNSLVPGYTLTEGVRIKVRDLSGHKWDDPSEWGKYAVQLAALAPGAISGKILTLGEMRKLFPGL